MSSSDSLAALVARAETGDPAAKDALFATLYQELHRLAQSHLHRSAGPVTLGATTLLHEAYLSLSSRRELDFPDRARDEGAGRRGGVGFCRPAPISIQGLAPRAAHWRAGRRTPGDSR